MELSSHQPWWILSHWKWWLHNTCRWVLPVSSSWLAHQTEWTWSEKKHFQMTVDIDLIFWNLSAVVSSFHMREGHRSGTFHFCNLVLKRKFVPTFVKGNVSWMQLNVLPWSGLQQSRRETTTEGHTTSWWTMSEWLKLRNTTQNTALHRGQEQSTCTWLQASWYRWRILSPRLCMAQTHCMVTDLISLVSFCMNAASLNPHFFRFDFLCNSWLCFSINQLCLQLLLTLIWHLVWNQK